MRIGLMTDTFLPVVDGVGRVVVAYANTLSNLGHEVTVSAPLYDTGYRGGYPFELVDYKGFKVPTSPQYKTGIAVLDSHYKKRMAMVRLDLVHSHSPFASGREALRLARQRCIPLVSTFHSKYYDDFLKATHSKTIAKAMLSSIVNYYDKCDEVWTVSKLSAEVLKEYGYKGESHVMTNGTQQRQTTPEVIEEAVERYGLGDLPVLLFVGQINWKKNILRILEAAALLQQTNPNFKLVLAGQGPDSEAIVKKADSLGLTRQLVMTGMISETRMLDALYARANLFVIPSLYDTFSLVIREAAAMKTPSVAIRGSCAAECIEHGVNGFLCQDNKESLYAVILETLKDPARTRAIGEQAYKTIPVPWEDVLTQAVARYEYLIEHHAGIPGGAYRRYQRKQKMRNNETRVL